MKRHSCGAEGIGVGHVDTCPVYEAGLSCCDEALGVVSEIDVDVCVLPRDIKRRIIMKHAENLARAMGSV